MYTDGVDIIIDGMRELAVAPSHSSCSVKTRLSRYSWVKRSSLAFMTLDSKDFGKVQIVLRTKCRRFKRRLKSKLRYVEGY